MKTKNKLNLASIKVESFVTTFSAKEKQTIPGGDVGSQSCGGPDCNFTATIPTNVTPVINQSVEQSRCIAVCIHTQSEPIRRRQVLWTKPIIWSLEVCIHESDCCSGGDGCYDLN